MGFVFLITPLFLFIAEKSVKKWLPFKSTPHIEKRERLIWKSSLFHFAVILLSFVIVFFKMYWLRDTLPFIFDFVVSMILGFCYGCWIKRERNHNLLPIYKERVHQLGTFALYGYIAATIQPIIYLDFSTYTFSYFFVLFIKTFIVAILVFGVILFFFRNLSYCETLVVAAASWTFMLNAPVVCMHGMRTVVNKYGAAPHVLLIIPPVILWLVNYIQLLLHSIFY